MKYSPTVLNVASGALLLGTLIYIILNHGRLSGGEGWGMVAMMGPIVLSVGGFVVDFFLQLVTQHLKKRSRNLARNLIGAFLLVVIYYYGHHRYRSATLDVERREQIEREKQRR